MTTRDVLDDEATELTREQLAGSPEVSKTVAIICLDSGFFIFFFGALASGFYPWNVKHP